MTESLYLQDSYLRECVARVVEAAGNKIELDRTVFYATGGGQPCDFGKIVCSGAEYAVTEVRKEIGRIVHTLDKEGLAVGDAVKCEINWERRYKLMRMHTAAHVLGAVMYRSGWLITGNQLGEEETRFDFSMESFDRAAFEQMVSQANNELAKNVELKIYELPREEAFKIPEIVKLANVLPPQVASLRIVEISGVDVQADGGLHVRNTSEVGRIQIAKLENKGAKNKRVYFSLSNN